MTVTPVQLLKSTILKPLLTWKSVSAVFVVWMCRVLICSVLETFSDLELLISKHSSFYWWSWLTIISAKKNTGERRRKTSNCHHCYLSTSKLWHFHPFMAINLTWVMFSLTPWAVWRTVPCVCQTTTILSHVSCHKIFLHIPVTSYANYCTFVPWIVWFLFEVLTTVEPCLRLWIVCCLKAKCIMPLLHAWTKKKKHILVQFI